MKTAVILAAALMAFATTTRAIEVTSVVFAGADVADGSNVTVMATFTGFAATAMVEMEVRSTDNLVGQIFQPATITATAGSAVWVNTDWKPYFTGEFLVHIRATDLSNGNQHVLPTNTIVARTIGGTINSVQVPVDTNAAYSADMTFTNIDLFEVFLNNIGVLSYCPESFSVGCNLLNSFLIITNGMTEEQIDIGYTDTGAYRPAGTPFRFDMNLHARPTSMMGFGEIKRFVWTPDNINLPAGPGRLVLDVASCSPWRNNYSTNLKASVGFAPLFETDTNQVAMMEGALLCTSAHYRDVIPTNSESDLRLGLIVNGHSNTTSYLKMFVPDTLLPAYGVTDAAQATNEMTGYVAHFNNSGQSEESNAVVVIPSFARIVGGTNIVYAYHSGTNGDSGYEMRFDFVFHSPVAAEMGSIGERELGINWVAGDFDGDRKSDPAIYIVSNGTWLLYLSASSYAITPVVGFGGPDYISTAGDFDGDGKDDPGIYNEAAHTLMVKLSAMGYAEATVTSIGGPNYLPMQGDYDGDRKADPAVCDASTGTFRVKLSLYNYMDAMGSWGFQYPNFEQVNGDFDGDHKADLNIYTDDIGKWFIAASSIDYLGYSLNNFGNTNYTAITGDFDGDRKTDPALYRPSNGHWLFALSNDGYLIYQLAGLGDPNCVEVDGDFDGDRKADPAVVDVTTGIMYVKLSNSGYTTATLSLIPPQ